MAAKTTSALKEYIYECSLMRKSQQTSTTTYRNRQGTILASSGLAAVDNLHKLAEGVWGGWSVISSVIKDSAETKKVLATSKMCTTEEKMDSAKQASSTFVHVTAWATPWYSPTYAKFKLKEK